MLDTVLHIHYLLRLSHFLIRRHCYNHGHFTEQESRGSGRGQEGAGGQLGDAAHAKAQRGPGGWSPMTVRFPLLGADSAPG